MIVFADTNYVSSDISWSDMQLQENTCHVESTIKEFEMSMLSDFSSSWGRCPFQTVRTFVFREITDVSYYRHYVFRYKNVSSMCPLHLFHNFFAFALFAICNRSCQLSYPPSIFNRWTGNHAGQIIKWKHSPKNFLHWLSLYVCLKKCIRCFT